MAAHHTLRAGAVALLSLLPVLPAGAQEPARERAERAERVEIRREPAGGFQVFRSSAPRAVLGITLGGGSARDTLGVLVSDVTTGGPADKAGIEEGNRIQSINGVNLRVATADAGDPEFADIAQRRLMRELGKVKPGDEVELRVWTSGQARTVKVRTANSEDLYRTRAASIPSAENDDRPWLGIGLGANGTRRDTLGVFVSSVADDSPAAKAGIVEGARIAEINGVSLRTPKEDLDDDFPSASRMSRFQRELRKLKAGDVVTFKVWQDGQLRTVQVKSAKMSDAPHRRRGMMFFGDGMGMAPMPPMPPMPAMPPMPPVDIEGMRNFELRIPELKLQLEGIRERIRTMKVSGRRMIVSV